MIALEEHARQFSLRPISSEQGVETYERIAVEVYVRDIIAELCKIDATRDEFGLGDGVWFDNHKNSFDPNDGGEGNASQSSSIHHPRPNQFCIHRTDGNVTALLTTVKYKLFYKLPKATIRLGLRPMNLYKDIVRSNKIP